MKIKISGDIDEEMLKGILEQIREYKSGEGLIIEVDSLGGDILIAEKICDILYFPKEEFGDDIVTYNSGNVCSAATTIFLLGDARIFDPVKGGFVIHFPYIEKLTGTSDDLIEAAVDLVNIEESLIDLYTSFGYEDREKVRALMYEDRPLTKEELVEMGFVTELV